MTLLEWCAFIGAVCTVVALLGGGVYYRGRRDGVTDQRDRQSDRSGNDGRDLDRRVTRVEEGLRNHKEDCIRRDEEQAKSLERIEELIERRYGNLTAQISNLARGDAGKFQQLLPPS